jgi:hypothetical protein
MQTFLICALTLLTLLGSRVQEIDVKGLENLKWGMTEKEVKKALGKDAVVGRGDSDYQLRVQNIQLFGLEFDAYLNLPKPSRKLVSVVLMATFSPINKSDFEVLEQNLILKYGTPSSKKDDIKKDIVIAQKLTRGWRLPSTTVGLLFTEIRKFSVMLAVDFADAKAEKE